ncbi:MAG: metallophosphoesterase [Bacteroidales bacterium]
MHLQTTGMVVFFQLSLFSLLNAQAGHPYSFIAAGHAYGAHEGLNTGLHPALLESLSAGFDTTAKFIVFTGDIVNYSTEESWQQVEKEMDRFSLPYYFVMGNHDNNEAGREVFFNMFGDTHYSFYFRNDLYIVLNSIEADRAISDNQLVFLQDQINRAGDSTSNIFIFFHEILWNSHEKYIGVKSNSRSRYDQVVNYSNYWEKVHPMLMEKSDIDFFLIAGDVGGNPDAISAFYDRWDHITLLASGMGEVADENYLLVHVFDEDSVEFELVPLNSGITLSEIGYYSVPPAPGEILGPDFVYQGSNSNVYSVPKVLNADSYSWEIPSGATGTSSANQIEVDFDSDFLEGQLSVRAVRDGFGSGAATLKLIQADFSAVDFPEGSPGSLQIKCTDIHNYLSIEVMGLDGKALTLRIFDPTGRVLKTERLLTNGDDAEIQMDTNDLPKGVIFISVSTETRCRTGKFVVR